MKNIITTVIGIIGGILANLLGGFDMALRVLIIFMAIDYISGLIVAGVFKNSTKTETGALQSKAGWKGLCRKGMTLAIVVVASHLDQLTGMSFIRDAVVIGYIANEGISILENAGLMGLPVGKILTDAIDILKKKAEGEH